MCLYVCLSVCMITWKVLQIPVFCLVDTYTGEKSRMSSHFKVIGQGQGHFSEGSRGIRLPIRVVNVHRHKH